MPNSRNQSPQKRLKAHIRAAANNLILAFVALVAATGMTLAERGHGHKPQPGAEES